MELKKNPNANLENYRGIFLAGGLALSLLIVYLLINLKFYDLQASELGGPVVEEVEEEIIPITEQNTPPPPPPPPPSAPEVIEIVEDDQEIEEEVEINTEVESNEVVEIFETEEEVVEEEVFTIVEDMPSFPGGEKALFEYLAKNVKYPPMAKDAGISGTVFVGFVVGSDGKIRDVKVLRGVPGGKLLDEEAVRVVKAMPPWKPGKQRGKPVSVTYNLPIRFILK
jgi:protein TonB